MSRHLKDIHTLLKIMDELRQATNEKVSAPALYTFLQVALEPGISQQKLAEAVNITMPSLTRNIQLLGKGGRTQGAGGHGLVEAIDDPTDARRKLVFLTPAGRNLVSRLVSLLTGSPCTVESPTARQALQAAYGQMHSN